MVAGVMESEYSGTKLRESGLSNVLGNNVVALMHSGAKIYPSNQSQCIPFRWSLVGFCMLWFHIAIGQRVSGDGTAMRSGSDV